MAATPTLYLHIGRNKAGSTSLQNALAENAAHLRANAIDHVLFNQPAPPGSALQSFPTHRHIAAFARAQPTRSVLVSHEGLCCFTPEMTRIMATDLAAAAGPAGLDTRVIFYIRPYNDWILSSYNFDTRTGWNSLDFDAYLEKMSAQISIFPMLAIWGEALGWNRIRVRSLHPADLAGGELATDAFAAMGIAPAPAHQAAPRANTSPSWWVIEMLRQIAATGPAQGWSRPQLAIAEALHAATDQAALDCQRPCPPAAYLTLDQAQSLTALYTADLALLERHTGIRLQPAPAAWAARPFLPDAACLPREVLARIAELLPGVEKQGWGT